MLRTVRVTTKEGAQSGKYQSRNAYLAHLV